MLMLLNDLYDRMARAFIARKDNPDDEEKILDHQVKFGKYRLAKRLYSTNQKAKKTMEVGDGTAHVDDWKVNFKTIDQETRDKVSGPAWQEAIQSFFNSQKTEESESLEVI